jgi:NADH:ubiquinone oxidoreductase subunit 2 (subunit N)
MSLPTSSTMLLAAGGLAMVSGPIFRFRFPEFWKWYFFVSLFIAACGMFMDPPTLSPTIENLNVNRVWINDRLAIWEQWLVLTFGLLSGVAFFDIPAKTNDRSRAYGFLLFVIAGLLLVARSNDFLSLGLSLEIISLATVALRQAFDSPLDSTRSLTTSVGPVQSHSRFEGRFDFLPSVWLWLGVALLTNCVATTHFDGVRLVLLDAYDPRDTENSIGNPSKLLLLSIGLIVSSLMARMGLVPFHWGFNPDIRQRSFRLCAPSMLVGPLIGSIALARLCGRVFAGVGQPLDVLMNVMCLASFALSSVMAVRGFSAEVKAVPRWVTSLMLLQSAWMGVGLMTVTIELQYPVARWGAFPEQNEALGLFVLAQFAALFACGGLVWTIGHLERADRGIEFLEDLKGLGRYAPAAAIGLTVSLASLIGCPLTAGFWSRWTILLAASNVHLKETSSIFAPYAGSRIILMVGILATVIVANSVIRLLREILLESALTRPAIVGGRGPLVASLIAAIATVLIGFAPQLLLIPLRSIEAPRELQPRILPRGSGRNHSVFRIQDMHLVKFDE